jgi:short-subunit dehydrogenase
MKRFDGRVSVVTGASSGIGRQIAVDLADRGATVVGLARRRDLLDDLRDELRHRSTDSDTVTCDVAEADQYSACLVEIERRYGRIDVLINNAGIYERTPVSEPTESTYVRIMATNFFAPVTGIYTVLPGMLDRREGVIVNVSSDSARAPEANEGAYAASKAALSAFTESAAVEVARQGVHIHVLYPAWVPTAMGLGDGSGPLPPKPVRRTAAQVSALVLDKMGTHRVDINASRLPLVAVIARATVPGIYRRAMNRYATQ